MNFKSIKKQRGVEIIEFALIVPILLLFFVAFLEFGIGFSDKAVIADASRAAAREFIRGNPPESPWCAANSTLESSISWGASGRYKCPQCIDSLSAKTVAYQECTCTPSTLSLLTPGTEVTVAISCPFQFRLLTPLMTITKIIPEKFNPNITLSSTTKMRILPH